MEDLFNTAPVAPLAELLRPVKLSDVVGQTHLLGPTGPLRLALESGKLHSFVLWGPPGVGKTTLARLAAQYLNHDFVPLSAVTAGVKEIREVAERAQTLLNMRQRRTVLFIDEIHRLNKAQQDCLLPFVESGVLLFLGASTENLSFELNAALLSRAQVYTLTTLSHDDLRELLVRAQPHLGGIALEREALEFFLGWADGDGRRFLGLLEATKNACDATRRTVVDEAFAMEIAGTRIRRFDREGEMHYDTISALHKSIRGSSPDAGLYWLARMLDGGADPKFLARRLLVIASEDIGNADPRALQVVESAVQAFERVGFPEGGLHLAHAVVYLACAPKSNAVYRAWNLAKARVRNDGTREVPLRLRNAPTQLMKDLGYHRGYRYAHDEPNAYAAGEHYFPDDMQAPHWYQPTEFGFEARIGERLESLRELDKDANRKAEHRQP